MPFGDGIPPINCYSLTDLHDFDECPFRFYVRHHLGRKYDIDESAPPIALGHVLDKSMKKFHDSKAYGCEVDYIPNLVRAAVSEIKEEVSKKGPKSFYASSLPFMTEDIIEQAIKIFQDYYIGVDKKVAPQIDRVGFCEFTFPISGDKFKLWGGPDALEMGDDGVPEIVDYKSRQDIEKGKKYMDMDLMPKIYTLLCKDKLLGKGYKKARFVVRFWQDPKEKGFYEEFDLTSMNASEFLVQQKIQRILNVTDFKPCGRAFCNACKSPKRDEFLEELIGRGIKLIKDD